MVLLICFLFGMNNGEQLVKYNISQNFKGSSIEVRFLHTSKAFKLKICFFCYTVLFRLPIDFSKLVAFNSCCMCCFLLYELLYLFFLYLNGGFGEEEKLSS